VAVSGKEDLTPGFYLLSMTLAIEVVGLLVIVFTAYFY
jgi:hypothetical protein